MHTIADTDRGATYANFDAADSNGCACITACHAATNEYNDSANRYTRANALSANVLRCLSRLPTRSGEHDC